MTDKPSETDTTDKPARSARRTLSLNRTIESGQVRQSFSHGRSKAVVVEKKRRRVVVTEAEGGAPATEGPKETKQATPPPSDGGLNAAEQQARLDALAKAKTGTKKADSVATPTRIGRKVERAAPKPAPKPETAPNAKQAKPGGAPAAKPAARPGPKPARPTRSGKDGREEQEQKRPAARRQERLRRAGKLTISDALNDDEERMRSLASIKRWKERTKTGQKSEAAPAKVSRQIVIAETITVQELAARMAVRAADVIKALMEQGMMLEINDTLDGDTAQLVAEELGHNVRRVADADVEEGLARAEDAPADKKPRPPVVTIMGHVDHGKTSLLDALRETNVVKGEAGGITQHIGAYQVQQGKHVITFLDTPGHAAFTQMRSRGSQLTDIVVLVVAADDGVMPQSIEAIAHAQAAKVPIIVAVNKMDVAGADPEKVRNELMRHNVLTEKNGGDVQLVEISALKKQGLDKLLEAIILQAELLELKANPQGAAEGVVLESRLDKGRGALATVLVQRGCLRKGDIFVVGQVAGRVRVLTDAQRQELTTATPGMPIEVLGATEPPAAGDTFHVVENETKAREVAEYRKRQAQETSKGPTNRLSMAQMLAQQEKGESEKLVVIIKADAQGSVEALVQVAEQLGDDSARVEVLHSAVGEITESDVILAKASEASILGFHVRANAPARRLAEAEKISLHYHTIIYEALDELKQLLENRLSPVQEEKPLGKAEVLEIFTISGKRKVAGSRVLEGLLKLGARARVRRGSDVLGEADIETLQHFKDKVKEVTSGQECGIGLDGLEDIQKGDAIDCFEIESTMRSLG